LQVGRFVRFHSFFVSLSQEELQEQDGEWRPVRQREVKNFSDDGLNQRASWPDAPPMRPAQWKYGFADTENAKPWKIPLQSFFWRGTDDVLLLVFTSADIAPGK
jgi:hypothetical protein